MLTKRENITWVLKIVGDPQESNRAVTKMKNVAQKYDVQLELARSSPYKTG